MSEINLIKGQKVNLDPTFTSVAAAAGWDVNSSKSSGGDFDLDLSVICLNKDGKMRNNKDLIFFGNKISNCMNIKHSGDNLTGADTGGTKDDETVLIELDKLSEDINEVHFIINIYEAQNRRQNFGMVKNAFVRIYDRISKTELLKYELDEDFSTEISVTVGRLYRHNGAWKFAAVGIGVKGGLQEYLNMYK